MFVKVRVKTGQKKESVERILDHYRISVREKPERGEANERVLILLARALRVPVARIRFVKGRQSPSKVFSVS